MKRMPKHLNTRRDYENIRELFPDQWRIAWQELLDTRFMWQRSSVLAKQEDGLVDESHAVSMETDADGHNVFYQMELIEDQNATIFRMGFTVDEVQDTIAAG